MNFTDAVKIEGTHTRDDGYLVVDARIARTGIQRYLGVEVGRPEKQFVDVLRPEAEVFDSEAMASFTHRPVTDDHPKEAVTKDNWKRVAIGQTSDEVKRDGEFLRIPLMVADGASIKKIQDGKRELSAGYTCELAWTSGEHNGQTYDAVQTNIRANHIAVVDRGRAGHDCRIGDGAEHWGTAPITALDKENAMTTRTVIVDGFSVETTDQGAQAIEKLQKDNQSLRDTIAANDAKYKKEKDELEEKVAKTDAALDDAKSKILSAEDVSKLVADRVALEATATKIAKDVKPSGLTDAQLKLAVVKATLGDTIPAAKLEDQHYVDARFDILAETADKKVDTFQKFKQDGSSTPNMNDINAQREAAFQDMMYYDQHGTERTN